jgi:hypothetical protein
MLMKKFLSILSIFLTFLVLVAMNPTTVSADTPLPFFTVKGEAGMKVKATLLPIECLTKGLEQVDCPTTSVEVIPLVMGFKPLVLEAAEHKFDLLQGIKDYSESVGSALYPLEAYGGVCVYPQQEPKALVKCGPVGGEVEF